MIRNPSQPQRIYWNARHLRMKDEIYNSVDLTTKELGDIYKATIEEMIRRLDYWYIRFAKTNNISLQDAKQILDTRELEDFRLTLKEYTKLAKQKNKSPELVRMLENASLRHRLTKEQIFFIETNYFISDLYSQQTEKLEYLFEKLYTTTYYQSAYETQLITGFQPLDAINDVHVKNLINERWTADDKGLSDRIWENKTKTIHTLKKNLTQGFMLKQGMTTIATNIQRTMKTSFFNARRLAVTESAHIIESACKDVYDKHNVEKYQILATLDKKTSKICRHLDYKIELRKNFKTGITAPPFHPHCRTTTIPYFDNLTLETRIARDENGKSYYVDGKLSYNEWYKQYTRKK